MITTEVGLTTTVEPETTSAAVHVSHYSTVTTVTVAVAVAVIAFVIAFVVVILWIYHLSRYRS